VGTRAPPYAGVYIIICHTYVHFVDYGIQPATGRNPCNFVPTGSPTEDVYIWNTLTSRRERRSTNGNREWNGQREDCVDATVGCVVVDHEGNTVMDTVVMGRGGVWWGGVGCARCLDPDCVFIAGRT
jgi:hypothetical protein